MLDGKWRVDQGSRRRHISLLKAKQHCSKEGKCFGIEVDEKKFVYSINFPIRLIQQQQGYYYIHKKESVIGTIYKAKLVLSDS